MNQKLPRVAAVTAPDEYILPPRPADATADAHRQTQFLLGADLDLFAEAMNRQLRLIKDARGSRDVSQAALAALWSRAYGCMSDAMLLIVRASYASVPALARSAAELIAAQEGLRDGDMPEYDAWLETAMHPNETHKAVEVGLGRYFAGGKLASDPTLRAVYRPAAELSRPHFGASLIEVAPESSQRLLSVSFPDGSFHLGWAEITIGWLLALAARQLRAVVDAGEVYGVSDDGRAVYESLQVRVDAALSREDRCRIEEIDDAGDRRYLVHNFRRGSGTAPKRFLL